MKCSDKAVCSVIEFVLQVTCGTDQESGLETFVLENQNEKEKKWPA